MESNDLKPLIGRTMAKVYRGEVSHEDAVVFEAEDGERFALYHVQECCESVSLEDVNGDLDDLVGMPIVTAYESCSSSDQHGDHASHTWTFYHIATAKGAVTLRWHGTSNGYYSEGVDLHRLDPSAD